MMRRFALKCIPDWGRTIVIDPIGDFRIQLRRHRSYWIRDALTHERFMLGALQRFVKEGDVVYDVGANIGLYVRFIASMFRAGEVLAFEPMTANRLLLQRNVDLGRLDRTVRVMPYALGDHDDSEDLQLDEVMSQSAALTSVTDGKPSVGHRLYGLAAKTERVQVHRLDTLVESGAVAVPDVMKIDIEGGESGFLTGAVTTLSAHSPLLIIELHELPISHAVLTKLADLEYVTYGFAGPEGKKVWRRVTADDIDGFESPYDLHHVVASKDEPQLEAPVPDYCPSRR